MSQETKGKLILIPSELGDTAFSAVFPELNRELIRDLRHFIVEDERTARRFIKKCVPAADISALQFFLLNEHTPIEDIYNYLDAALQGNHIGLLSEAGMPCIADPGAGVVRMAHEKGIEVLPLIGPSSVFLALAASGFNGQSFCFHGYLPVDKSQRNKRIKELEQNARQKGQTQIFIETPYRNIAMFEALLQNCRPDTSLCIACNITTSAEYIRTFSIAQWKNQHPDLHKKPAIFLLN
jgi:16S rRNA (cytidine1402-2'-O)-methyltransferase